MREENRISAGGVVYRMEKGKTLFLLIGFKRRDIWCLPKGLVESGESERDTAQREVKEETGITHLNVIRKIGSINYRFWLKQVVINKTVHFYLFKTDQVQTQVGEEHDMYAWFSYDEALASLTYKNEQEILIKANNLINEEVAKGVHSTLPS